MSDSIIPLISTDTDYKVQVSLDQDLFILRFRYNLRDEAWFFSMYDSAQNPLLVGKRLVKDGQLTIRRTGNKPLGELVCISSKIDDVPTQTQLGSDALVIYISESEFDV